jgi:hypothetical protein
MSVDALFLAVEPIRLVTGADEVAPASVDLLTLSLLSAGVVGLIGLVVVVVRVVLPRISFDRDPTELAFSALARKLGLGRAQRATVRTLAEAIGEAPVALTLCRSAFARALGAAGMDGPGLDPADRARLLELEHRIFG